MLSNIHYTVMGANHSQCFTNTRVFLGDLKIPLVIECKYLDITISEKNCDQDIHRQMRNFYSNANILRRRSSK